MLTQTSYRIIRQYRKLTSLFSKKWKRCLRILNREDKPRTVVGHVIYEIVNPLIYLRLEEHTDGIYSIHFGIEPVERLGQLTDITTRFLRLLYKVTMLGAFPVDIESCVRTDWFVHNVSGLYEYLEESEKYTFKLIPYKVTASKQRQMKAVAWKTNRGGNISIC